MEKKIKNFNELFQYPPVEVGDIIEVTENKETVVITKIENKEGSPKISFRGLTGWEKIGLFVKIRFTFAWYDLFVGLFYDRRKNWIYILPVPMCVIIVKIRFKLQWLFSFEEHWCKTSWKNVLTLKHRGSKLKLIIERGL